MKAVIKLAFLLLVAIAGAMSDAAAQPNLVPPLGTVTGITELTGSAATENALEQNFPNPAIGSTTIVFSLVNPAHVTLHVFDVTGKIVSTLVNEQLTPAVRSAVFNTSTMSSGIYFYQLKVNAKSVDTKRLLILSQ